MIEHPSGEEIQFDWVELPDPPAGWDIGGHAHLLVGALAHSGRWRAVLVESEDFPHLVQALDAVLRKLGGTARRWRVGPRPTPTPLGRSIDHRTHRTTIHIEINALPSPPDG